MGDLTLFEALTGGAFDLLNWQHSGEFDQNFSRVKCPGVCPGGGGGNGRFWNLPVHNTVTSPNTKLKLRSTDSIPSAIRGCIKHHKKGNPLRPIVSSIGSALYNTSKFLTNILTPLQNVNGFSVTNSSKFADEISNIDIQDDEIMLSFDMVSLFTAIPVKKACEYIQNKLDCDESLHLRTNLDTTDIIFLLKFVLSNNYLVYNDNIYKQIHGCAMGSPVSPVVANLCIEAIEEMAINTTPVPPKVWKRYVDDSFCIIKKNAVDSFHNTLNSIDQHISFTNEEENNNPIAFLDALVSRN